MRTSVTKPTVVLATAALLVVVGCGGGSDETGSAPSPSSTPTTPVTPTDTASPPVLPDDEPTDSQPFPANRKPDIGDASADPHLSPVDLRFGVHQEFDRVVLDLAGTGRPGWRGEYVERAVEPGSGRPVDLAGGAVLQLVVDGLQYETADGAVAFDGPRQIEPERAGIVDEVVYESVFEGRATVFIGVSSEQPFRVFQLEDPARVVVDVVHGQG